MIKKSITFLLLGVLSIGVYFWSTKTPKLSFEKIITLRLKDTFGFPVKLKSVNYLDEIGLVEINGIEFLHPVSKTVFLRLDSLKGSFDKERLNLKNELYFPQLELSGITLPMLETKLALNKELLDVSFRSLFREWDNTDAIEKNLDSVRNFHIQSKLSQLKYAERIFQQVKSIENRILSTKDKRVIEDFLSQLEKADRFYTEASSFNVVFDPEKFISSKYDLVKKSSFFEKELLEFILDKEMENRGKSIVHSLRALYKAQFFSSEARLKYPHLTIDTIKILEKKRADSKTALVGFIKNLSSKHSNEKNKFEILLQGDFDKYDIKGIDFRLGIFKDDNKIITYNIFVQNFPLSEVLLYQDKQRALISEKSNNFLALRGIVHKSEVKGDLTVRTKNANLYRSPLHDSIISQMFDIIDAKDVKQMIIIFQDHPEKNSFVEVEYGDEYLGELKPSKQLIEAYFEDVIKEYYLNLKVKNSEVETLAETLKPGYEKLKKLIELAKSKL